VLLLLKVKQLHVVSAQLRCTQPVQITVSQNEKRKKYISIKSNYITPKEMVEDQSADYAATHVGKKYPSLWPPIVYRPP
jgi:hypothetical protein